MSKQKAVIKIQIFSQSTEKPDISSQSSISIDFKEFIPAFEIRDGIQQILVDIIRSREKTGSWPEIREIKDDHESNSKE